MDSKSDAASGSGAPASGATMAGVLSTLLAEQDLQRVEHDTAVEQQQERYRAKQAVVNGLLAEVATLGDAAPGALDALMAKITASVTSAGGAVDDDDDEGPGGGSGPDAGEGVSAGSGEGATSWVPSRANLCAPVQRGPHWHAGDQDGGAGTIGHLVGWLDQDGNEVGRYVGALDITYMGVWNDDGDRAFSLTGGCGDLNAIFNGPFLQGWRDSGEKTAYFAAQNGGEYFWSYGEASQAAWQRYGKKVVDEGTNGTKSADEAYQVVRGDGQAAYDRVMARPLADRASELEAIKAESGDQAELRNHGFTMPSLGAAWVNAVYCVTDRQSDLKAGMASVIWGPVFPVAAVQDSLSLWLKAEKRTLDMSEEVEGARCPNKHAMVHSDYSGSGYGSGYVCDRCRGSSSQGLCGGSRMRWFCVECSADVCFNCVPKDGSVEVRRWIDQSPRNNHATAYDGAGLPTFCPGHTINGLDTVRFERGAAMKGSKGAYKTIAMVMQWETPPEACEMTFSA